MVGIWLFLAAPKIILRKKKNCKNIHNQCLKNIIIQSNLDVEKRIPFTKPKVDRATKIDIIAAYFPTNFSANVIATAFDSSISFGVNKVKYATFVNVYTTITTIKPIQIDFGKVL